MCTNCNLCFPLFLVQWVYSVLLMKEHSKTVGTSEALHVARYKLDYYHLFIYYFFIKKTIIIIVVIIIIIIIIIVIIIILYYYYYYYYYFYQG